jgi:hypothetical protein
MDFTERKEAVREYEGYKSSWFNMYMRYIVAHYLMSATAIILSVVLTFFKQPDHKSIAVGILGMALAIDTGFLGLFGAERKANQAIRAWRILGAALTRFLYEDKAILQDVITAWNIGEDIIHETHTRQAPPANGPTPQ